MIESEVISDAERVMAKELLSIGVREGRKLEREYVLDKIDKMIDGYRKVDTSASDYYLFGLLRAFIQDRHDTVRRERAKI